MVCAKSYLTLERRSGNEGSRLLNRPLRNGAVGSVGARRVKRPAPRLVSQRLRLLRPHLLRKVNSMARVASLASACWAPPNPLALAVAKASSASGKVLPVSDERARWR